VKTVSLPDTQHTYKATHYSMVILTAMNTQYICIYNNTKRLPWHCKTCV